MSLGACATPISTSAAPTTRTAGLVLSRLALTHLIPVFDMAIAVDPNPDGSIRAMDGRVTTLLPEEACLRCRGRISPEGLAAEDLAPDKRRRRAGEGYLPGRVRITLPSARSPR
jgi:hypothetical protein